MAQAVPRLGPRELERVLVDALDLTPDATLIMREDWVQVSTPSSTAPTRNGVLLARLRSEEVEERAAEVARTYAERGARFRWVVGPGSAPDDLSARLEAAGIPKLVAALGMTMSVPSQSPDLRPGLRVLPIGTAELDLFAEVTARCWERESWFGDEAKAFMSASLARGDGKVRSWLAFEDGEPVATTTLHVLPGLGYLQGAAVLPDRRRRGIYRALIHHRLGVLRELGIEHAVIWADETSSARVCAAVGFTPVTRAIWHETADKA